MAPITRNQFPKVVIERDEDSEPSSSEEEEEDQEEEEEEEEEAVKSENGERKEEALDEKKKGKAPITISLKKVCKVKAFTYPGAHMCLCSLLLTCDFYVFCVSGLQKGGS
jgi:hypothetical protein